MDLVATVDKMKGFSDGTREQYTYCLKMYQDFCIEINQKPGIKSLAKWLEKANTNSTYNVWLAAAKNALRIIYKDDPKYYDLEQGLKLFKNKSKIHKTLEESFISYDEYNQLLEKTHPTVSIIINALYITGLRIQELLDIKLSDCSESEDYINIKSNGLIITLEKQFFNSIIEYFNGKLYLFEHDGKQYSRKSLTGRIKKEGYEILKKNVSAHTFRYIKTAHSMDIMQFGLTKIQDMIKNTDSVKTINNYLSTIHYN